jgi:short-subunit dehydrogenase
LKVKKKNILITGSSSSIGEVLIKKLNYKNNVLLCQINSKKKLKKKNVFFFKSDFNNNISINHFIKFIVNKNIKIDYLIHLPASKISVKRFEKFSWKEIQRQINIQVKSLHLLIIKLIHHKIFGNKVKIIVIGSEVTKGIPPKGMLDYICGKGLLHYYCLIAKIELVKYNIKLIYLRPGMFQSPLLSNLPEFFLKKYINNNSAKLKTIKTILKIIK